MSAHIAASALKQTKKLKEEDWIFLDLAKFLYDANKTKSCVNTSFSFSFLTVYNKENI